ncbi:MAG: hypothetical protein KJ709_04815 [Nanoarchaeota archaeon]|nr:hypothetical protein [Nanoarchaeota archaeon]
MKDRITVSIDKDLLSWVDSRIRTREFANRSHAFELLVSTEMKRERESWSDEGTH